jgi:GT2 family glycosyltransferase
VPEVSVIIPAYGNAAYLGGTIRSVLNQTYPDFELIVVNDASPDDTGQVIRQFEDSRLRYLIHPENRGLSAARNTGMRASTGRLIALLDGDDLFHPEKLRLHVEFHRLHPDVGTTYNARFELNHSAESVRDLWRPPTRVSLADLAQGFPFSPSDMVMKRDWAFRVNLFDERFTYYGEDLDINCRLSLAGCTFVSVDRALNYRRYYSARVIRNLRASQAAEISALTSLFADPRCSADLEPIRKPALASRYLGWAILSFAQDETDFGRENCLAAVGLEPGMIKGKPSRLVESFLDYSLLDDSEDHASVLDRLLDQLPSELTSLREESVRAVASGFLRKGSRAVMWGRIAEGKHYFAMAAACSAHPDEDYLRRLAAQILSYEDEFGAAAAREVVRNLSPYLGSAASRWLKGCCSVNRAFAHYRKRNLGKVPREVVGAMYANPGYVANRGLISILLRSLVGQAGGKAGLGARPVAQGPRP